MKGIFLVKSRISVNDHDMEDFKIFKDTTRKEVEKLIKKGINELFEDSQEFELIDSFYNIRHLSHVTHLVGYAVDSVLSDLFHIRRFVFESRLEHGNKIVLR